MATFLEKVYNMIETCPPATASWSKDGKTFIVKDQKTFASELLPKFFRHSNFSSFVRQLNFYGFRKLRNEGTLDNPTGEMSKEWWEFKHDKFVQGQREMMKSIHRKTYASASIDVEAFDKLKTRVQTLEGVIVDMNANMTQLRHVLWRFLETDHMKDLRSPDDPAKLKMAQVLAGIWSGMPTMPAMAAPPLMDGNETPPIPPLSSLGQNSLQPFMPSAVGHIFGVDQEDGGASAGRDAKRQKTSAEVDGGLGVGIGIGMGIGGLGGPLGGNQESSLGGNGSI